MIVALLHDWARRSPGSGLTRSASAVFAWIIAIGTALLPVLVFMISFPGLVADFYLYTTIGLALLSGITGSVRAFKLIDKREDEENDYDDKGSDDEYEAQDSAVTQSLSATSATFFGDERDIRRRLLHPKGGRGPMPSPFQEPAGNAGWTEP